MYTFERQFQLHRLPSYLRQDQCTQLVTGGTKKNKSQNWIKLDSRETVLSNTLLTGVVPLPSHSIDGESVGVLDRTQ